MTERLYQRDSFLRRFEATVLEVGPARGEAGPPGAPLARFDLVLDRTAFYPTGGGQPSDGGTIQGLKVVDVREGEGGIAHTVEGPNPAIVPRGGVVRCEVDWWRRFDHMQHHSGQHLLSRAFLEVAAARTRSFHLGEVFCSIDIEMSPPDPVRIEQAEERTNGIIWNDLPVQVLESRPEDPALSGLRLKPGESVRTIQVAGFDSTPCGGTHVSRTGQVGIIAVVAWEPIKKLTRVTFVCGGRVARRMAMTGKIVAACVSELSVPETEVPGALRRLVEEKEELHHRLREMEKRSAQEEAAREAGRSPVLNGWTVLARTFDEREKSLESAQALMRAFVGEPSRIAVVAVARDDRATLLAARSSGTGPALGQVVSAMAKKAGGRGGGSDEHARAGGLPADTMGDLVKILVERLTSEPGGDRR